MEDPVHTARQVSTTTAPHRSTPTFRVVARPLIGRLGAGALVAAVAGLVAAPSALAARCHPRIIDLGALPGGTDTSAAIDLNDAGEIVGWSTDGDGVRHAVRWIDGHIERLPVPGESIASDNNRRDIVGYYHQAGQGDRPFRYENGRLTNLPLPPGFTDGGARRINQRGEIAGTAVDANGHEHAVAWDHGRVVDLGVPAGYTDSYAIAINNRGQIGGGAYNTDTGADDGGVWSHGRFAALHGPPGDLGSEIFMLDDHGSAGGFAYDQTTAVATVWDRNGTPRPLGLFPHGNFSIANASDDHGNYVGGANYTPAEGQGGHVFLSRNGGPLQTLRPLNGDPIHGGSGAHGIDHHSNVAGSSQTPTATSTPRYGHARSPRQSPPARPPTRPPQPDP
jgi:probable HAF family extracellular repeat protein